MLETIVYTLGASVILGYLAHVYMVGKKCTSKKRLDGKVVIVTGANCGIGYETALDLAKRGGTVILACRDQKRGQAAVDKIVLESNNNKVVLELLDLGSLKSIRDFAERIKRQYKRLDLLINNAGLLADDKRLVTKDGFEMTFGVNHLGPFLLTNLLLDLIKSSAPSRIINVSSLAHYHGQIHWDNVNLTNNYAPYKAYMQSKLANVLFTKYLAKQLEGTNVLTVSLHPGGVRTEIYRDFLKEINIFKIMQIVFLPIYFIITKNCEEGAQTSLHCALDDEDVPNHNGEYFSDCKCVKMAKLGSDMVSAERLWKLSCEMVGLKE